MIDFFRDDYAFLSNFHEAPFILIGVTWPTVEHFFQAHKTLSAKDRAIIYNQPTPGRAKKQGRKVELRPDWESVKFDIMSVAVDAKFLQNIALAVKLIATEDVHIEEGNTWHDNIWGNCHCTECTDIDGHNLLGEILMNTRIKAKALNKGELKDV